MPIFKGFLTIWSLQDIYIPILLLKSEVLKKKSRSYHDSENWPILTIIIYHIVSYFNNKSVTGALELPNVDIY